MKFNLKHLFLIVAGLSVAFSWYAHELHLARVRKEMVEMLSEDMPGVWCNDVLDPVSILKIANRLRRMGKRQTTFVLKDYAKVCEEFDGDLHLLVPLLFRIPEHVDRTQYWWFDNLFVEVDGFVFHICPSQTGSGPRQTCELVDWATTNGVFRSTPVTPTEFPVSTTFKCAQLADTKNQKGEGYARMVRIHLCNQLFRSLGGEEAGVDFSEVYHSIMKDTPESKIVRDRLDDRIKWDAQNQKYVVRN